MTNQLTFHKTHPWLRFALDLRAMPVEFWLLLGEVRSKCEHLASAPILPETAAELHRVYLAKGAAATTAIEGNTLTEEEVRRRLEGQLELPPSMEYLGREIDNFVAAVIAARVEVETAGFRLRPEFIRDANRRILADLRLAEGVVPGEFRAHSVTVGRYLGAPAREVEYLGDRLCEWLNELVLTPDPSRMRQPSVIAGVIKGVLAHLYLAWVHPFGDGNGRTARFVEYSLLVSAGVPSTAAHLLSNHYNQTRAEYYRQLDAASRSGGDVGPFLSYAVTGFVDQLTLQLGRLHEQHRLLVWRTHVDDCFPGKRSGGDERQRALVLALTERGAAVALADVPNLGAEVTRAYATRTSKTLTRDLQRLEQLGLVERSSLGVRARTEIVAGLQPGRAAD